MRYEPLAAADVPGMDDERAVLPVGEGLQVLYEAGVSGILDLGVGDVQELASAACGLRRPLKDEIGPPAPSPCVYVMPVRAIARRRRDGDEARRRILGEDIPAVGVRLHAFAPVRHDDSGHGLSVRRHPPRKGRLLEHKLFASQAGVRHFLPRHPPPAAGGLAPRRGDAVRKYRRDAAGHYAAQERTSSHDSTLPSQGCSGSALATAPSLALLASNVVYSMLQSTSKK